MTINDRASMPGGVEEGRFGGAGSAARTRPARRRVVPAIIAFCLAALPAAAQQNVPVTASGGLGRGGESPTPPSADLTAREQLWIVGSATMQSITDAVIERLRRDYVMPQPIIQLEGTRVAIKSFCSGVGPQFPDIVAAADRMTSSELQRCVENDVLDVIEVTVALSAIVVVTKKGNPVFDVSARMVYRAVAEQVPIGGEFAPNPHKSWRETRKDAPDLPIQVIIPSTGAGTRSTFDGRFLQGGCRHVKEIDAIFAAAERVPLCITLRGDGVVTELPEQASGDNVAAALAQAPPGTIAIVARLVYLANQDKFDVLPVKGVEPSSEKIANYDYEMFEFLRYYFKRAHMRDNSGVGVVRGIREFMGELVKDEAFAEGGYLERLGLVPLAPEWRAQQQTIVRRLKRFAP
jgi:phosphate transport system substrate-binding protein